MNDVYVELITGSGKVTTSVAAKHNWLLAAGVVTSNYGSKRAKYLECPCCTVSFAIVLCLIT